VYVNFFNIFGVKYKSYYYVESKTIVYKGYALIRVNNALVVCCKN